MHTPQSLRHRLRELLPAAEIDAQPPEALLALAEAAAEARPADRHLAEAIRQLLQWCNAGRGLGPEIAAVRRQVLVRWDAETTTWIGPGPGGGSWMVRALRPHADSPAQRRRLAREARALRPVLPELRAEGSALAAPAPGQPVEEPLRGSPGRLARLLSTGITALHALQTHGLGPPRLSPHELRALPDALQICSLSPGPADDLGPALETLAAALEPDPTSDSELSRVVHTFTALPPRSIAEATELVQQALAQDLSARWHGLVHRQRATASARRHQRLHAVLHRLVRALPPPPGQGAVGVDLQGQVTLVRSDGHQVEWGPPDDLQLVWSATQGFDAPLARRLLRTRASGIPTPRMHAQVGGEAIHTETLGRWIAAGLRLRTIQLLLEKAGPASR